MTNSNGSAKFRTGIVYENSTVGGRGPRPSLFRHLDQGISNSTREHDKPLNPFSASVERNLWAII